MPLKDTDSCCLGCNGNLVLIVAKAPPGFIGEGRERYVSSDKPRQPAFVRRGYNSRRALVKLPGLNGRLSFIRISSAGVRESPIHILFFVAFFVDIYAFV